MKNTNIADWVIRTGIFYLCIPNVIFLLSWVNPWLGLPLSILLIYACTRVILLNNSNCKNNTDNKNLLLAAFMALLITALSGTGGLTSQPPDYLKHNLLFHDLITSDWPVYYKTDDGKFQILCYSSAYYLVPALIAKVFDVKILDLITFLWTFTGLFIFFCWVTYFGKNAPARTLLIFYLYAGLGIVWYVFKHSPFAALLCRETSQATLSLHLQNVGLIHNYLDSWAKIFNTPQHALASWLGTALIYELAWVRKNFVFAALIWSLTLLWSPFTSLGLAVVLAISYIQPGIKKMPTHPDVTFIAACLVFVVAVYYNTHLPMDFSGPIWQVGKGVDYALYYFLFILIQVFIPVACIYSIDSRYRVLEHLRPLFWASTIFLIILPLYKIGYANDLRLQASTPALVFIALSASRCLTSKDFSVRKPVFLTFSIIFFSGATFPLCRPILNLCGEKTDYSVKHSLESMNIHNLSELNVYYANFNASAQYLGNVNSPVARYILRQPSTKPKLFSPYCRSPGNDLLRK